MLLLPSLRQHLIFRLMSKQNQQQLNRLPSFPCRFCLLLAVRLLSLDAFVAACVFVRHHLHPLANPFEQPENCCQNSAFGCWLFENRCFVKQKTPHLQLRFLFQNLRFRSSFVPPETLIRRLRQPLCVNKLFLDEASLL